MAMSKTNVFNNMGARAGRRVTVIERSAWSIGEGKCGIIRWNVGMGHRRVYVLQLVAEAV